MHERTQWGEEAVLPVLMEDTHIDLVLEDTKKSWSVYSIPTKVQTKNPILVLNPQCGQQSANQNPYPFTPPPPSSTV